MSQSSLKSKASGERKQKSGVEEGSSKEKIDNFVWTDDEIQLLLKVTGEYKANKEMENIHWNEMFLKPAQSPRGGGGNDTPWLRVPAARIFKELPCFGVTFSNIHPASESDFLSGIFSGGIHCYANFFCYANFSIVFKPFFWGEGQIPRANCLMERTAVSGTMYQNTKMSCFQRKP